MGFDESTHETNDYYRDALAYPISLDKVLAMVNHYQDNGSHQTDLKYSENVVSQIKKSYRQKLKGLKESDLKVLIEEVEVNR